MVVVAEIYIFKLHWNSFCCTVFFSTLPSAIKGFQIMPGWGSEFLNVCNSRNYNFYPGERYSLPVHNFQSGLLMLEMKIKEKFVRWYDNEKLLFKIEIPTKFSVVHNFCLCTCSMKCSGKNSCNSLFFMIKWVLCFVY